jgi:hypothetical protein
MKSPDFLKWINFAKHVYKELKQLWKHYLLN